MTAKVPLRCTAMTASQSASVAPVIIASRTMPALFTTPVRVPKVRHRGLRPCRRRRPTTTPNRCARRLCRRLGSISATTSAAGPLGVAAGTVSAHARVVHHDCGALAGQLQAVRAADAAPAAGDQDDPSARVGSSVMAAPLFEQFGDEVSALRPVGTAQVGVAGFGDDQVDVVGGRRGRPAELRYER